MLLTSVTTDGGAREFAHGCATEAKKKHIYCLESTTLEKRISIYHDRQL